MLAAISRILVLVICICTIQCSPESTWMEKKMNHQTKTLSTTELKRASDMSDIPMFNITFLKPLMKPRVSGTEANKDVQKFLSATMKQYDWTVEEDKFTKDTPFGEKEFNNIIATQDPQASRKLTLACHFDSKFFEDINFIGATDSAVPCAMMLDIAYRLHNALWATKNKKAKDISLQFIFFDGKEAFMRWTDVDSIYGARHLAASLEAVQKQVEREVIVSEIQTMDVMVIMNLIGAANPEFRSWFSDTDGLFKKFQNIERRFAQADMLNGNKNGRQNIYFYGDLMRSGGIQDDHIPFLNKGVPILHLICYPFPKVWHKESDNWDSLDFNSIDDLSKIMRVFVAEYLHLSP